MSATPTRERRRHRTLGGTLRPDTAFDTTPITYKLPLAGADTHRIRAKVDGAAATLSFAFLRPNGEAYAENNPDDVALADGAETLVDITCSGEEELLLTFTGAGSGTIAFIDVMQAPL
jgi:hypothetical protein